MREATHAVLPGLFGSLLLALSGCGPPQPPPSATPMMDPIHGHLLHAQPRLPTLKLWLGDQELNAEIARRPVEIATGMMFRTNLLENEAMLFVFAEPGPKSFYMRNCLLPLSAAYIEPDGTIAEIVDLHPGNEQPVPSQSTNIQFVLEVRQGWFARHNIRPGALVRTERGPLREAFFASRAPSR